MKRLDVNITYRGFEYRLFRRSDTCAMYKQYEDGEHVATEMFVIPVRKAESIKGVDYPEREVFPSDSYFGDVAWSLLKTVDDNKLVERFEKLDKEENERIKNRRHKGR